MVKLLYHQAHLPFKIVMLFNKVVHIISVLPLRLKEKKCTITIYMLTFL